VITMQILYFHHFKQMVLPMLRLLTSGSFTYTYNWSQVAASRDWTSIVKIERKGYRAKHNADNLHYVK